VGRHGALAQQVVLDALKVVILSSNLGDTRTLALPAAQQMVGFPEAA